MLWGIVLFSVMSWLFFKAMDKKENELEGDNRGIPADVEIPVADTGDPKCGGLGLATYLFNRGEDIGVNGAIESVVAAGVRWERSHLPFRLTNDSAGWEEVRQVLSMAKEARLCNLIVLHGGPPSQRTAEGSREGCNEPFAPTLKAWAQEAVKEVGALVDGWEILNEPDLPTFFCGTPEEGLAVVVSIVEGLRESGVGVPVLLPSLTSCLALDCPEGAAWRKEFIQLLAIEPLNVDALNIHIYSRPPHDALSQLEGQVRGTWMEELPLWITETNTAVNGVGDEAAYGAGMEERLQEILEAFSSSTFRRGPIFWFNLKNGAWNKPTGLLDSRTGMKRVAFRRFGWIAKDFPLAEEGD